MCNPLSDSVAALVVIATIVPTWLGPSWAPRNGSCPCSGSMRSPPARTCSAGRCRETTPTSSCSRCPEDTTPRPYRRLRDQLQGSAQRDAGNALATIVASARKHVIHWSGTMSGSARYCLFLVHDPARGRRCLAAGSTHSGRTSGRMTTSTPGRRLRRAAARPGTAIPAYVAVDDAPTKQRSSPTSSDLPSPGPRRRPRQVPVRRGCGCMPRTSARGRSSRRT